ncbi:MAG TPA: transcriptional regulator [Thermoanaerobacterales bacterium]|nr:transcriptional regulator [Thermoanaerobacterales bacterium]
MWIKVLWLAVIGWVLQGILAYFQIKNFQKQLEELRKKGRVGLGIVKGRFGRGVIVILCINNEGIITDAQIMSGTTVFARFVPFNILKNRNITDIESVIRDMRKHTKSAILKALASLEPAPDN